MSGKRTRTIKLDPPVTLVPDLSKTELVKAEEKRLFDLFTGADPNKLDFIRDTVRQLAWLGVTIVELQKDINERGAMFPYDNGGNQKGIQANPACKTLKDFQALYNAGVKVLLPVLPESPQRDDLDIFRDLLRPRTPEEIAKEEAEEEAKRKRIDAEIAAAQKKLEERRTNNNR